MRPLNLRLQGFTCFSDPVEIDFRDMDVFAITGPTGSGKTTIVDAICYALYGRVPRQEGTSNLISHDRDAMSVTLTFDAGGESYRVHRGISRGAKSGRRGPSPVQLEVCSDGEWQPLAGRVRSLDEEINRIVGLDFKGFTACVLLPQGRFQEFLAGDKRDRREVLKELLDSGIYEQVMAAANARAARLQNDATSLSRRLQEDYTGATPEALAACREALGAKQPLLETARSERDALIEAASLAKEAADARARAADYAGRGEETLKELAAAQALAAAGQERLATLRQAVGEASEALRGSVYDREGHADLRLALARAEQRDGGRRDLAEATERASDESALAAATAAADAAGERLRAAEASAAVAKAHLDEAQRRDVAAHLRQGLRPGDTCPVCGETVSEIAAAPAVDLAAATAGVVGGEREQRAAVAAVEAAARELIGEQQRRAQWRERVEGLTQALATAEAAVVALLPAGHAATSEAIEAGLAAAAAAAQRFEALSRQAAALREELDGLTPQVASSDQEIAHLEAAAVQLEREATAANAAAAAATAKLLAVAQPWRWQEAIDAVAAQQDPRRLLNERGRERQAAVESLNAELASLNGEAERLAAAIERAAALREELATLKQGGDLYHELGRLLRADAFQAFVIEEAMAVLAAGASEHLQTLYPRFALTVGDGEFEVIDHWQADQTRPARTLSGGETFAVSLALALSLAERMPELRNAAAASLESLFLDEGFGTLDGETLETVIGALEGLRSEERLVVLITHVPELARRIECRIEVRKSPAGSSVSVVSA